MRESPLGDFFRTRYKDEQVRNEEAERQQQGILYLQLVIEFGMSQTADCVI